MRKTLPLLTQILLFATFLNAADVSAPLKDAPGNDIFINTTKENITISAVQDGGPSLIYWQKRLCNAEVVRAADKVIEVKVTPRSQNAFFQKILRIPRTTCNIKIAIGKKRNIYASSEVGNIKLSNVQARSSKLYTAQGIIEIANYKGNLSAETLTSRITLTNAEGEDLKLKTASGNINAGGLKFKNADILNTSGKTKLQGVMQNLVFYSSEGPLNAKWDSLPKKMLNISARSFTGNIKIIMPQDADLESIKRNIELKSIYGSEKLEND